MNTLYLYFYLLMGALAWAAAYGMPNPPVLPSRESTQKIYSDCQFRSDGPRCEEERAEAQSRKQSRQAQLRDLLEENEFAPQ